MHVLDLYGKNMKQEDVPHLVEAYTLAGDGPNSNKSCVMSVKMGVRVRV